MLEALGWCACSNKVSRIIEKTYKNGEEPQALEVVSESLCCIPTTLLSLSSLHVLRVGSQKVQLTY